MDGAELWNHIIVRDGRVGADPSQVTAEGGPVIHEFDAAATYELGQRLTLPDGTEVLIGQVQVSTGPLAMIDGAMRATKFTQTLTVENVWD